MIPAMSGPSQAEYRLAVLQDADLCVKCGLCLPHCPTYGLTRHEADSPRGRIALTQGLLGATVPATASLQTHLDGCLSCRKCEVVCPAQVPYGRILDAARTELAAQQPQRTRLTRGLATVLVPRAARRLLRGLIALYRKSGLQRLVRASGVLGAGRLARLESLLPAAARWRPRRALPVPAELGADAPRVALFEDCVSSVLERDVRDASAALLRAAGYQLVGAPAQTCCGALHQHAGLRERALELAQHNLAAFPADAIVASFTSGCAASLRDYRTSGVAGGAAFAARVQDLTTLLRARIEHLQFRALPMRAVLHLPCTLCNVMKADGDLRHMLHAIPELDVVELDGNAACCGAAGSHFLTHPQAADALLAPKLDALQQLRPDLVLSSNIGCRLHLQAGLTRLGRPQAPPVLHPALVLAAQLGRPPPRS